MRPISETQKHILEILEQHAKREDEGTYGYPASSETPKPDIIVRLQEEDAREILLIKRTYKIDIDFIKALKYCMDMNEASESLIKKYFPIGCFKAKEIIEWMKRRGYISKEPRNSSGQILITEDEFRKTFETSSEIANPILKT